MGNQEIRSIEVREIASQDMRRTMGADLASEISDELRHEVEERIVQRIADEDLIESVIAKFALIGLSESASAQIERLLEQIVEG